MQTKTCPDCGDDIPFAAKRHKCGWFQGTEKRQVDQLWWQCANTIDGMRCTKAGSISHGTHGEGPWFCQDHAFPANKPTAPPSGFGALKAIFTRNRPPNDGSLIE